MPKNRYYNLAPIPHPFLSAPESSGFPIVFRSFFQICFPLPGWSYRPNRTPFRFLLASFCRASYTQYLDTREKKFYGWGNRGISQWLEQGRCNCAEAGLCMDCHKLNTVSKLLIQYLIWTSSWISWVLFMFFCFVFFPTLDLTKGYLQTVLSASPRRNQLSPSCSVYTNLLHVFG